MGSTVRLLSCQLYILALHLYKLGTSFVPAHMFFNAKIYSLVPFQPLRCLLCVSFSPSFLSLADGSVIDLAIYPVHAIVVCFILIPAAIEFGPSIFTSVKARA